MSSSAIIGMSTTLSFSLSSASGYTALTELVETGWPEDVADEVDVTHYLSASSRKEFIAGWIESGEIDLDLNYIKAQMIALYAILRTTYWWKITLADGGTVVFQGHLKSLGAAIPNKDRISTKAKVRVTGPVTFS